MKKTIGTVYIVIFYINILEVKTAIEHNFDISPWLFLVPALLFIVIILKVPPLPALMFGTLIGAIAALIFQPELIKNIGGYDSFAKNAYVSTMQSMFGEILIQTKSGLFFILIFSRHCLCFL